ncbi:MAG: endonuclease/exonuclease/phosphatase family protein [Chloroflexia bacterium]
MITPQTPQPRRARRVFLTLAAAYPLLLLILSLINTLQPKRTGFLGLSEVFAPYLFLPLILYVPLLFVRKTAPLRILLIVCAVVYGLRFPPRLISASTQSSPGAIQLSVTSWNVLVGGWKDEITKVLQTKPAAIVGMVEADWNWLSTDPTIAALYPYRAGVQAGGPVTGQVLLTTYPIIEQGVIDSPPEVWSNVPRAIWARLDVGLGRNIIVVVAHPPPGKICSRSTFPRSCYDTSTRDKQLAIINAFVQPYLKAGAPLLLIGDFNVTEREPAYNDISSGLIDTHKAIGKGIGNTWGPGNTSSQLFPFLRIDYLFASPNLTPISTSVDCSAYGSDHCMLSGHFELK